MSDAFMDYIAGTSFTPLGQKVVDAVSAFTRHKMYRLEHVPMRYYLDPALAEGLKTLLAEINSKGFIDLDAKGEPCCLSGEPAVLKEGE